MPSLDFIFLADFSRHEAKESCASLAREKGGKEKDDFMSSRSCE
jgi:hypothetical protein